MFKKFWDITIDVASCIVGFSVGYYTLHAVGTVTNYVSVLMTAIAAPTIVHIVVVGLLVIKLLAISWIILYGATCVLNIGSTILKEMVTNKQIVIA